MLAIIGEFIGTYLMLTLGFVISEIINYFLYPKLQTRYITGLYWGISVFIPSLICTKFFATANFSPVFSVVQLLNGQISWWIALSEMIAQIVAAWLSAYTTWIIWDRYLYTLPINLNFFATVPRYQGRNWYNFGWEFLGTALIAINSQVQGLWMSGFLSNWLVKTIISWWVITFCITLVSPITGAAFNPTRDLVPRAFFSHKFGSEVSQWSYWLIPFAGPFCGMLAVMLVKSILELIF